jgi:hypothetical protein
VHRTVQVLQEGLGTMASVQRKWLYLEPVFSRGALPEHAPRFQQVLPSCCCTITYSVLPASLQENRTLCSCTSASCCTQ